MHDTQVYIRGDGAFVCHGTGFIMGSADEGRPRKKVITEKSKTQGNLSPRRPQQQQIGIESSSINADVLW